MIFNVLLLCRRNKNGEDRGTKGSRVKGKRPVRAEGRNSARRFPRTDGYRWKDRQLRSYLRDGT